MVKDNEIHEKSEKRLEKENEKKRSSNFEDLPWESRSTLFKKQGRLDLLSLVNL